MPSLTLVVNAINPPVFPPAGKPVILSTPSPDPISVDGRPADFAVQTDRSHPTAPCIAFAQAPEPRYTIRMNGMRVHFFFNAGFPTCPPLGHTAILGCA